MPRHPEAIGSEGFTLIEAMVALVILSGSLFAFYNFLSGALTGASRVQAASIAFDRHTSALELATTLNPMEMPQGSFDLGSYRIAWASRAIEAPRKSSGYPAGWGEFKIGLYRVILSFPDSTVAPIEVTRVGFHRGSAPSQPIGDQPPGNASPFGGAPK